MSTSDAQRMTESKPEHVAEALGDERADLDSYAQYPGNNQAGHILHRERGFRALTLTETRGFRHMKTVRDACETQPQGPLDPTERPNRAPRRVDR